MQQTNTTTIQYNTIYINEYTIYLYYYPTAVEFPLKLSNIYMNPAHFQGVGQKIPTVKTTNTSGYSNKDGINFPRMKTSE